MHEPVDHVCLAEGAVGSAGWRVHLPRRPADVAEPVVRGQGDACGTITVRPRLGGGRLIMWALARAMSSKLCCTHQIHHHHQIIIIIIIVIVIIVIVIKSSSSSTLSL